MLQFRGSSIVFTLTGFEAIQIRELQAISASTTLCCLLADAGLPERISYEVEQTTVKIKFKSSPFSVGLARKNKTRLLIQKRIKRIKPVKLKEVKHRLKQFCPTS